MSTTRSNYRVAAGRAGDLCELAASLPNQGATQSRRQTLFHASLAAHTAAWQAYVEGVCREAAKRMADPLNPRYVHLHTLHTEALEDRLSHFNTPNWENSRTVLVGSTGFDPIASWTWPARGRSAQWVKERWKEILRVRHSFAHGSGIPAYTWTQTSTGQTRLTADGVRTSHRFFENLVTRTDRDLGGFLRALYGAGIPW